MDDSEIIALYFQRKEQAIAATAAKYGRYCMHIADNILQDSRDAEETVSDAWMDAWNTIPPHRPNCLRAFLGTIVRRRALDRFASVSAQKRGGGQVELALEELSVCIPSTTPEEALEAAELAETINRFLRALPAPERRIFVCRYWYLDSIKDISAQFGFSQSKVKSVLFRTRGKLRRFLEKEGVNV